MTFEPKIWKDWPDLSTPISGAALTDMENRLAGFIAAGGAGMDWKGDWDPTVTYEPGDSVYWSGDYPSGGSYIATDTSTGVQPFPDTILGVCGSYNLNATTNPTGIADGEVRMNSTDPSSVTKLWFSNVDLTGQYFSYFADFILPTQLIGLGWPISTAGPPPEWDFAAPGAHKATYQITAHGTKFATYWEVDVEGPWWDTGVEAFIPGEAYVTEVLDPGYGWSEPNEGWDRLTMNGRQGPQGQGLYIRGPWHPLNTYGYQDVVNYPGVGDTQYIYTGYTQTDPGSPVPPAAPWAVFLESEPGPAGPEGPQGAAGGTAGAPVTTLPVSPINGQECYYNRNPLQALGLVWHLRYSSADHAADGYGWEFLGGAPIASHDPTPTPTNPTHSTYQGTAGPLITCPATGLYDVEVGGQLTTAAIAGNGIYLSTQGAGLTADDNYAAFISTAAAVAITAGLSALRPRCALTVAQIVTPYQRSSAAGVGQVTSQRRTLKLTPVRLAS